MKYTLTSYSVLLCLLFSTFSLSAQWGWGSGGINGEGNRVSKTLDIDKFSGIGLALPADVHLIYGKKQKVEIKAQKNIIDNIERDVRSGVWNIKFKKNVRNMDPVDIFITLPDFDKVSIAGAGSIIGKDRFQLEDLKVSIAGSGEIELEGTAEDLDISIAGSGDVELKDLKARECKVSIAGSGACEINVEKDLAVKIAGSGDVRYKGNPSVKSSIAGSGDVSSF